MISLLREIGLLALALSLAAAATFAAGFWEARFFDLLALWLAGGAVFYLFGRAVWQLARAEFLGASLRFPGGLVLLPIVLVAVGAVGILSRYVGLLDWSRQTLPLEKRAAQELRHQAVPLAQQLTSLTSGERDYVAEAVGCTLAPDGRIVEVALQQSRPQQNFFRGQLEFARKTDGLWHRVGGSASGAIETFPQDRSVFEKAAEGLHPLPLAWPLSTEVAVQ